MIPSRLPLHRVLPVGCALALVPVLSAADQPAAKPAERAVELAPVTIEASALYVPQEPGWEVAEVPGFRVYSHGSPAAKRILADLQVVRETVGLVWGDERLLRQWITVVVCADEPEFLRWGKVASGAFDRLVRAVRTPTGIVLVVNGADDTINRAVGRAYVRALIAGSNLPRWLQEGLASILNSAELQGDRLIVGKVARDPRDQVTLDDLTDTQWRLASLRSESGFPVSDSTSLSGVNAASGGPRMLNSRGDEVELLVDGMPPTVGEMKRAVNQELDRRRERLDTAKGDTEFSGYLTDSMVMDLDKLLDPQAEETIRWRMNAWAFTHLGLFGDKSQFRPAFASFIQKLQQSPERKPVELFREAFNQSPGSFELRMRTYAEGANYEALNFKLEKPFAPTPLALTVAPESSVLLLKARVYTATGREGEARGFLQRGYAEPSNRTPSYIAAFAQVLRAFDRPQALRVLEAAEQKSNLDHAGRRLQAELRLETFTAKNPKLTPGELAQVLNPLFAALNQGDNSEHLFVLIGRAWLASAVPPRDEHLNALRLGLSYYPQSARIGDLLKQLEHKG